MRGYETGEAYIYERGEASQGAERRLQGAKEAEARSRHAPPCTAIFFFFITPKPRVE